MVDQAPPTTWRDEGEQPAEDVTVAISELSEDVYSEIKRLCAQGDRLSEEQRYQQAIVLYEEAWDMLPPPREGWEAATWILAAIGDAEFNRGDFAEAREKIGHAMRCPGAIGNPFLHLRLGQCQLEMGYRDRAADELARAYMGAGKEAFQHDDEKYFKFLRSVLKEPEGGW
jgi:tetratricopeptide (TPR) repeat protein